VRSRAHQMPSGTCTASATADCRGQPEESAESRAHESERQSHLSRYLSVDRRDEEREEHKPNNDEDREDHELPCLT
jgi:hypothetical protein